jgi:phage gp29-like protein
MLTHDWAEHSAAAIILGETMDAPSDTDTFLVTDPAGAFVVREQLKFWA